MVDPPKPCAEVDPVDTGEGSAVPPHFPRQISELSMLDFSTAYPSSRKVYVRGVGLAVDSAVELTSQM